MMPSIPDPTGLPAVELREAFLYDCPQCGAENVVRIVEHEPESPLGQDCLADLQTHIPEFDPDDVAAWGTVPRVVHCRGCQAALATELPTVWSDDDDDDDGVTWREH